ncbi:hypothetical protein HNR00_000762 [Methylorubrum rhodinum]|jgi:hypothetical protein|uniref:Anti-sigma factor NepR domain-containing protein n=1 Tax=Methylorubrum rhodinum TaxID=29428 RepID=A0A840ZEP7_9HYPH|nr:hypothetical protein [Methylorubrum rhodinum]MBB5756066.1 hypothetical protein [Methylorubrum rhodinum]
MPAEQGPVLDAQTRERLGRQLKALYDPVFDEPLDPRLTALVQQLEADKREAAGSSSLDRV